MPNNILIRRAELSDVNLISIISSVTFYEAYFEQDEPPDLANYCVESFAPEKIHQELENPASTFLIACQNGKAVGYAKLRDGENPAGVAKNSIELQRIYTIERIWGKGVGEILLQYCFKTAKEKGFQNIWLGVWEENIRAQKFYAKFGFRQAGTLLFPYGETFGTNMVLEKEL